MGTYGFQTYVHEIGHALGLGHAGNYNGSADYSTDALFANDGWPTTIMSYFDQRESAYFGDQGFSQAYLATPMIADFAAIQLLYGASTTTRTGNTTYGFNSTAGRVSYDASLYTKVAYTVIDSGGTDTLDYSGFSANQTINLTAGTYSNVGGLIGNVSIALGTIIENAIGGSGYDILRGNAANNLLTGGGGNDQLYGDGGFDVLIGGSGSDTMTGGAGGDTFQGTASSLSGDTIVDFSADDFIVISDASLSTFTFSLSGSILTYSGGSLTLQGSVGGLIAQSAASGGVQLRLGAANMTGTAGDDTLTGSAGDDTLDGLTGADTMSGDLGNDTYIVDNIGDKAIESSSTGGNDVVNSSVSFTLGSNVENLALTGTAAISATGNALNNVITGNSAANRINGGLGADTMSGGLGNDTYTVDNSGDQVIETSSTGGTDSVASSVSFTLGAHVENLTLTGLSAVNGVGNTLNNRIVGNSAANSLSGGAGNDVLNGMAGSDTLIGGTGDDVYYVSEAGDVIFEYYGEGTDSVQSSISFTLGANLENLALTGTSAVSAIGNALNNTITGNSAANMLNGGLGADSMSGGLGNDTYMVDNVGDRAIESSSTGGTDLVKSSVSFTLGTNVENLTLIGTAAINGNGNTLNNVMSGNGAVNVLNGGAGSDKLSGQGGADTLNGGLGNDVLSGGAGTDTFLFDTALSSSGNVDQILDFSVFDDTIQLDDDIFTALGAHGSLSDAAFQLGTSARDSSDRIIYDSGTGNIYYDADGSGAGAAVMFAQVTAGTALTNIDFMVIG